MTMRQVVAARLLAMIEDERDLETRPIEEIRADLRLFGIDPNGPVTQARHPVLSGQSPATVLLAQIEAAEATEREIAQIGAARIEDVRAGLEAAAAAAGAERQVNGVPNAVGGWLRTKLGGWRPWPSDGAFSPAHGAASGHAGAPRERQRDDWLSPTAVVGLLRLTDAVIVLLAALAAWYTRFHGKEAVIEPYLGILAVLLTVNVFQFADLYNFDRLTHLISQLRQLVLAWATVLAGLLVIGFMTKMTTPTVPLELVKPVLHATSRIWVGLWFSYGLFGLILARLLLIWQIHRWQAAGRLTRHMVVVGAGEHGQQLVEQILKHGDLGVRIVGIFDDRRSDRVPGAICGVPVLGNVADLVAFARQHPIDQIIIALPWHAGARILAWMGELRRLPVEVCFCPHVSGPYLPQGPITEVAGVPMLNVVAKPLSGWTYLVKSMEGRAVAAAILLLLLPMFLLIALLIKLESRGPVLVRQKRQGFNKEVIEVYQFRTTYVDHRGDRQIGPAARSDPRITSFGRFLRRATLDELPQFINVLLGTMSVVGPMPHAAVRG